MLPPSSHSRYALVPSVGEVGRQRSARSSSHCRGRWVGADPGRVGTPPKEGIAEGRLQRPDRGFRKSSAGVVTPCTSRPVELRCPPCREKPAGAAPSGQQREPRRAERCCHGGSRGVGPRGGPEPGAAVEARAWGHSAFSHGLLRRARAGRAHKRHLQVGRGSHPVHPRSELAPTPTLSLHLQPPASSSGFFGLGSGCGVSRVINPQILREMGWWLVLWAGGPRGRRPCRLLGGSTPICCLLFTRSHFLVRS